MQNSIAIVLLLVGIIAGASIGYFATSPITTVTETTVVTTSVQPSSGSSLYHSVNVSGTISLNGYTAVTLVSITFTSLNYSQDLIASTAAITNSGHYSISLPNDHSFSIYAESTTSSLYCGAFYLNTASQTYSYVISC
ncbi:MAG: hypothetical protein JRN20_14380 [Nitrososphaerota archaeon]|nr:hypothetical protein [Nitrososphaerota archaeon]MDG6921851.1 hypothetical protein [Nitrososphaerota archaeon]